MAGRSWVHERRPHGTTLARPTMRLRSTRGARVLYGRRWDRALAPTGGALVDGVEAFVGGIVGGIVDARQCETCGNVSRKTFQVIIESSTHVFDSFECAITAIAPTCERCGCRVLGHGVEHDGALFCCEGCRRRELGASFG